MVCAIVPAAGRSRRMGAQKLLLPFGGDTVIGQVVSELARSSIALVLVVVRPDDPVAKALARRPVRLLVNPDPEGDMLSSVRCGLRVLPEDCQAVLVALGDQPAITAGLVEEMCRAFWQSGRGILTPVHRGRRGHPLLFSRRYVPELLQAHQGVGLRGLLQAHPEDIFELPVPTPEILEDLDTPEDYLRAGRRAEEPRG